MSERQLNGSCRARHPFCHMLQLLNIFQYFTEMKNSEFVVAINMNRDAPIGEEADVLVVADLLQFVPTLTEKLQVL